MPVALKGSSSGDVTLTAPAVAGTTTITLPATTGNAVVDVATQTLTNKTLTSPTINSPTINTPTMGGSVITSATAQATTSGTEIPFTGIPSWVKRITVLMTIVSTNGTSSVSVQIGSGSYVTSGYTYAIAGNNVTDGFRINGSAVSGSTELTCVMTITNMTGNTWVAGAVMTQGTTNNSAAGFLTLSGTLDRLRLYAGGVNTFDAGTINILYE